MEISSDPAVSSSSASSPPTESPPSMTTQTTTIQQHSPPALTQIVVQQHADNHEQDLTAVKSSVFARYVHWLVILIPIMNAGLSLINKVALSERMDYHVLALYRNMVATAIMIPLVVWMERQAWRGIDRYILLRIVFLAILEPVMDQNFAYAGLLRIPASLSAGLGLTQPILIFILSVIFRLERLDFTRRNNQVKVVGVVIAVAGAIVIALSPGNKSIPIPSISTAQHASKLKLKESLPDGLLFSVVAMFSAAAYSILLNKTMDVFKHPLTITTLVCFIGAVVNVPVTFTLSSREGSQWMILFDSSLAAYLYSGIVTSVVATYLITVIIERKGPVFVALFSPFSIVIVISIGVTFMHEQLTASRLIAIAMIVFAMSLLLWGKHGDPPREELPQEEREEPPQDTDTPPQVP